MPSWISSFVAVVVLVVVPMTAHAQRRRTPAPPPTPPEETESPTDREARSLFTAGQEAFAAGNYERALEDFEQAYALSQRAGLLYNIAVTADRMRRDARALEAFRGYLAAEPETERRAEVEARIAFLEQALAEPEPVDPTPTPPPPAQGGVHPAGIGVLIAAGALFVSFAIFAGLSTAEDQSLASSCGRDSDRSCTQSQVGTLEAYNLVADISWIAGGAAAIAGVILLLVLPPESESPTPASASLRLTPWASPQGAGMGAVGRW